MLLRIPLKSSLASQTLKEIQMETLPHCNSNGDTVPTGAHCKKKKSNKTKVKQKPNPPQAASYTTFILLFKENRHDEHFPNSKLASLVNTWPSVPPTVIFCGVKKMFKQFWSS